MKKTNSTNGRRRLHLQDAVYSTELGVCIQGDSEGIISKQLLPTLRGKVDLIFTSPPFPLNTKKKYGNLQGQEYSKWLAKFGTLFSDLLSPTGSIVIELGNAWEPKRPVMSTLALRSLLLFLDTANLTLCQEFVWYNPARLPSPAQWVTIERIRVKDAYTHVWWLAKTDRPYADNRQILTEYSKSMKSLLSRKKYNDGKRPSEHSISPTSFLKDNEGAIPSNVISAANTQSSSPYLDYCRENNLQPHPARMPEALADFFIRFLTKPKMLVLDPFAGSNTTGATAERRDRRWISIEAREDYVESSCGRFENGVTVVAPNKSFILDCEL
jgi:site-specific DNA-methyltransferase (cytosine-N4-specific)